MLYDFVKAVRNKTQTPQDVYDENGEALYDQPLSTPAATDYIR